MRDSVPSTRYSPVCNVLRQWKTSLIPTYRVYPLHDTVLLLLLLVITMDSLPCFGVSKELSREEFSRRLHFTKDFEIVKLRFSSRLVVR